MDDSLITNFGQFDQLDKMRDYLTQFFGEIGKLWFQKELDDIFYYLRGNLKEF